MIRDFLYSASSRRASAPRSVGRNGIHSSYPRSSFSSRRGSVRSLQYCPGSFLSAQEATCGGHNPSSYGTPRTCVLSKSVIRLRSCRSAGTGCLFLRAGLRWLRCRLQGMPLGSPLRPSDQVCRLQVPWLRDWRDDWSSQSGCSRT